jgi:hypothetical protein
MAKYEALLYESVSPGDGLGADVLVPRNQTAQGSTNTTKGNIRTQNIDNPSGIINVHEHYAWTLSPLQTRQYIPRIEITEYKQLLSSELVGLAYQTVGDYIDNARVAAATLPTTIRGAGSLAQETVKRVTNASIGPVTTNVNNFIGDAATIGAKKLESFVKTAQEMAKNDPTDKYTPAMRPYAGLYVVEPTGWNYYLPYISQDNLQQSNNWGNPGDTVFKDLMGGFAGSGAGDKKDSTSPAVAAAEVAGASITDRYKSFLRGVIGATGGAVVSEKPQAYLGPNDGNKEVITVRFWLYNTVNFEDIRKNWEFCYLFTYQNLPNRKGINLMDPPCLYKLTVPGYRQFPMCTVESLAIRNVGAVRMINISKDTIVSNELRDSNIKLIPEAYEIEIKFKHAFNSARNLFAYAENPDAAVTVTVTPNK